jgi:hypothetical protein
MKDLLKCSINELFHERELAKYTENLERYRECNELISTLCSRRDYIFVVNATDGGEWNHYPVAYFNNHQDAEECASKLLHPSISTITVQGSKCSKAEIIDDMDDMIGNKISATLLDIMTLKEDGYNPEVVDRMERVLKAFMSEYYKIRCK